MFWDTLPRGVRISTKNNALEEQGLWLLPIHHFCCYSDFSRQMSNKFGLVHWAVSVYISRFGTIPKSIGPWSLHMSRSSFGQILGHTSSSYGHTSSSYGHNSRSYRHNSRSYRHNSRFYCHNSRSYRHNSRSYRHNSRSDISAGDSIWREQGEDVRKTIPIKWTGLGFGDPLRKRWTGIAATSYDAHKTTMLRGDEQFFIID